MPIAPHPAAAAPARAAPSLLPVFASRGRARAWRWFHPLCGASPDTLVRLLLRGGVRPGRAHVAAIALGMAALRAPFALGEAAVLGLARGLERNHAPPPPPVFVLGHWRSGTTHLANLLARTGAFGILSPIAVGLPSEALGLGRVAGPFVAQFLPATRLIDEMALAADLPQEDELALANLSTLSCHHGLYFPDRLEREFDRGLFLDGVGEAERARWARRRRRFLDKMTRAGGGGRPLLVRNPADGARIPALRALWPDARFVHIHRHPADVVASSARMFATLLRELSLGDAGGADARAAGLVERTYPRLMRALLDERDRAPPDRFVELRYDDLVADPLASLGRVFARLDLPGFDPDSPALAAEAARRRPPRPVATRPPAWLARHGDLFARLGYDPPDPPARP